jgi:hypothetical protein
LGEIGLDQGSCREEAGQRTRVQAAEEDPSVAYGLSRNVFGRDRLPPNSGPKRSSDRPEGFDEAISPKITHFPADSRDLNGQPTKEGVALTFGHVYGFVPDVNEHLPIPNTNAQVPSL